MARFRVCPDSGFFFDKSAESLIKVNAVAAAVFGGATRGVFGVALYHFVAEDRAVGPFTVPDLQSAARTG